MEQPKGGGERRSRERGVAQSEQRPVRRPPAWADPHAACPPEHLARRRSLAGALRPKADAHALERPPSAPPAGAGRRAAADPHRPERIAVLGARIQRHQGALAAADPPRRFRADRSGTLVSAAARCAHPGAHHQRAQPLPALPPPGLPPGLVSLRLAAESAEAAQVCASLLSRRRPLKPAAAAQFCSSLETGPMPWA